MNTNNKLNITLSPTFPFHWMLVLKHAQPHQHSVGMQLTKRSILINAQKKKRHTQTPKFLPESYRSFSAHGVPKR